MKLGRNDPCPCGSGKKYKKCCGSNMNNVIDFSKARSDKEKENLFERLFVFVIERWHDQFFGEFNELKPELPPEADEMIKDPDITLFFEVFAFNKKLDNGRTPFEEFMRKYSKEYRLSTLEWFEECKEAVFSLYEVLKIDKHKEIIVKDLLREKTYQVKYEEYFDDIEIGDAIWCRLSSNNSNYKIIYASITVEREIVDNLTAEILDWFEEEPSLENMNDFLKENASTLLELVMDYTDDFSIPEEVLKLLGKEIPYEVKYAFSLMWIHLPNSELQGLTPIQASYEPFQRKRLEKILYEPEAENFPVEELQMIIISREVIFDQLGLGLQKLKFSEDYTWSTPAYKQVAKSIKEKLKEKYSPLQVANCIKMWFDFLQKQEPRINKPLVWVAVIEFALNYIEFGSKVTKKEFAEIYGISPSTISNRYKELNNVLKIKKFDERYSSSKVPIDIDPELVNMEHNYDPEKAQELVDLAWESSNKEKGVDLAYAALRHDPECVDAYVILGNYDSEDWEDARFLYQQGVEAGERVLGKQFFAENKGYFWGIIKTRPYMRAKYGLAEALWNIGEREEAIQHLFEMLELNPNDNQGCRYALSHYLLAMDEKEKFDLLLQQYEGDISAEFFYNNALFQFRLDGDSKEAQEKIKIAMNYNKYVPDYLLKKKRLPKHLSEYYSLGSEDEAILYAVQALKNWQNTPGGLKWLSKYYWLK